ncbi:MAG: adenylate cyclase [Paraglaciecola sp.]|jgi:adenylate cyclase
MSLFNELKKRNVIRVGLAYLVSAWVIAQVASLVLGSIKAPDWVMQSLLFILMLGFVIALIISWTYELTPEGLKKDSEVTTNASIAHHTARKLDYITLAGVILVVILFIYQQLNPSSQTMNEIIDSGSAQSLVVPPVEKKTMPEENSIAVLPFVDMSQEGNQEYFADGISEEILNVLVRIKALKVAGRTSSFSFKNKNEDLRVIGESLGVNHILEGSVRHSNTKLRITAQLIRSIDGFHLWSETYDREMTDIFEIQDEIAQEVANQLIVSLGLEIKSSPQNRTDDLEVYEYYLKAKQLFTLRGRENLDQALTLLNKAKARDPNYAPAWTLTAFIYGVYEPYTTQQERIDNYKQWHTTGKAAAKQAIGLDPQSGEAYAALANFYFLDFDFIQAVENYERALELASENPIVIDMVAQNYLDIGYFQKSKELAEQAIALDPLVAIYRNTLGQAYIGLNQQQGLNESFEKAIELDPTLRFPYSNLKMQHYINHDVESFNTLLKRQINNGIAAGNFDRVQQNFLNDSTLLSDKGALEREADNTDDGLRRYLIWLYLKDIDKLAEDSVEDVWSREYRSGPRLFSGYNYLLYRNKRWKEQVRKDGILALWQAKGFPSQCKAVGDDDFECIHPNRGK